MIFVEYCVKNFTPAFTLHRLALKWSAFLKFISCIAFFKAFLVGEKGHVLQNTNPFSGCFTQGFCKSNSSMSFYQNKIEVLKISTICAKVPFSVCLWHLDGKTARLELFGASGRIYIPVCAKRSKFGKTYSMENSHQIMKP